MRTRSVMVVVLNSAKSQLLTPAPRKWGSKRLSEPNVKAAGLLAAARNVGHGPAGDG
jgi:hypothetical protein